VPVHSSHTIRWGTTSKLLLLYARDATGQTPETGLTHDTPGASAAYVREGEAATPVPLSQGAIGTWSAGGFVEVDPDLLPGVYQFGAPDQMLASGSAHVLLVVRFPGVLIDPVEADLVAYDPLDQKCIGMTQLGDERRHQFLRQALPRLTEQELMLGVQAESELASRLADEPGP
jgi:hypothetical protein